MEEIEYNKQKIIDTLASFKMNVTPCKATVGPTVTLYEVIPESGIKVSRIKTMEDDIAMSLKSEGGHVSSPPCQVSARSVSGTKLHPTRPYRCAPSLRLTQVP